MTINCSRCDKEVEPTEDEASNVWGEDFVNEVYKEERVSLVIQQDELHKLSGEEFAELEARFNDGEYLPDLMQSYNIRIEAMPNHNVGDIGDAELLTRMGYYDVQPYSATVCKDCMKDSDTVIWG